jgi:hypothetical protein
LAGCFLTRREILKEGKRVKREEAIEAIKLLFIATVSKPTSAAAAVATVLFDNAIATTDPKNGLTRSEIGDAASALWAQPDGNVLGDDAVNTQLGRLRTRLLSFVRNQNLSKFNVTDMALTSHRRSDGESVTYLQVDYVPPSDQTAGVLATAIDAELPLSTEERAEVEEQLAAGKVHVKVGEFSSHPFGKGRVFFIFLALLALSAVAIALEKRFGILADPVFPLSPPHKASSTGAPSIASITVSAPPAWALKRFRNGGRAIAGSSAGTHLYVASGPVGVRVFDMTDPENPRLDRTIKTTNAYALAVAEPYIYVADGDGGTRVVDLRKRPGEEIVATLPSYVLGIALGGTRLYTANGAEGVRIWDVMRPEHPRLLQTLRQIGNGAARNIAVSGSLAFVARERVLGVGAGTTILDVSDPHHVQVSSLISTFDDCHQVLALPNNVVLEVYDLAIGTTRTYASAPFVEGLNLLPFNRPIRAVIPVANDIVAAWVDDDIIFVDVHDPKRLRVVPEPPIDPAIFARAGLAYIPKRSTVGAY